MKPSEEKAAAGQTANWNQLYRPKRIGDLHLHSVRTALLNLMTASHFPQTLLFAGPKGTGKTSVARIIGAMLNDPGNSDAVGQRFFSKKSSTIVPLVEPDPTLQLAQSIFSGQSYVVQELDAASNRGIDDVRALKERSALPPNQGLVTVYILDEVHMLTMEAFNALLKLLEEPPAHVVFVLATTELHKLPDTIISRCHVIRFHKASTTELKLPLEMIAADQKLLVAPATLTLLAQIADGSFRDAVKLLQQFAQQIASPQELAQLTESLSDEHCITLLEAVVDKQPTAVVQIFESLRQQGADEVHFLRSLLNFLHQDVLKSLHVVEGDSHFKEKISRFFLQQLSAPELVKPAPIPFLRLELVLLDVIDRARSKSGGTDSGGQTKPIKTVTKIKKSVILMEPETLANIKPTFDIPHLVDSPSNEHSQLNSTNQSLDERKMLGDGQLLCEKWQELIAKAADHNFGLAALLRSAHPLGGGEGEVVVRVYYTFHKEQLLNKKWRTFWDEVTTDLTGGIVALDCVVEKLGHAELSDTTQLSPAVSLQALAVDALMH